MIGYSNRALKALVHLFRAYNDIDIYVEDRNSNRVYQLLLDRYLNGRAKVVRVFSVGNREAVLTACRDDQAPGGRPRLYLVDGDFDFVLERSHPGLARLHRLNCYSMENLLWCVEAMGEVAADCLGLPDAVEAKDRLGLQGMMDETVQRLADLAIVYAAVHEHVPEIETSGRNVHELCVQRYGRPVRECA
jgi:hypothetical protein